MASPFPHMSPGDVPLFASFVLSDEGKSYEAWGFDVHLGAGVPTPGLSANPTVFDIGRYLTQLRLDAIGWRDGQPTIFEVKPEARLSAVGQVIVYCNYYRDQFGYDCTRAVITDYANAQTLDTFARFNIIPYQVLPATLSQINEAVAWVRSLPYRAF